MKKPSILVVEDDPSLGYVLKDNLVLRGYDVLLCVDGNMGWDAFQTHSFDICILDVMLPKRDGFSLGKSIREKNQIIPILFLTAKSMTEDKLQGFKLGGDDYITKPFNMEELVMRIEVFLKRSNGSIPLNDRILTLGKFTFDHGNLKLIHQNGDQKTLTTKESEVLKLLILNNDRVMKREEILTRVWGEDDYFMGRSMDVFISKLRKYLKDDPSVEIVNYHGIGFKLEVKD